MGSIIDTGIFVALERGSLKMDAVLADLSDPSAAISAITAGYRVITRDSKSFPSIAGLEVVIR